MDATDRKGAAAVIAAARGFSTEVGLARRPAAVIRRTGAEGVHELCVRVPGASSVGLILPCGLDEHFAGFGEQFTQVDKRGRVIDGWLGASVNVPARFTFGLDGGYKIAPLYYSSSGYAAFLSAFGRWRFDMAVSDPHQVVVSLPGEEIVLRVVDGYPAESIPKVTALTGRPPLAPPWAYGVWKNVHGDDAAILAEARRLREEGMGASALWFFDFYEPSTNTGCGAGGTYGVAEHADLGRLVSEIHALGFRALTYLNAWVFKGTPCWDQAMAAGFVMAREDGSPALSSGFHPVGGDETDTYEPPAGLHSMKDGTATLDLSNPRAREWWQAVLRRVLLEEGFDGWMEDFGEGVPDGVVLADGTTAAASHNRFPLLYHSAAAEELRRSKPDAVFFARSGYLGCVQDVPVFWPGDQTRDWSPESGIACLPAAGISIGLMGVAAWGPDIAGAMGFAGLGGGHGLGFHDKELWIRWCQLGAMTPVMREHLGFHDEPPVDAWTDAETIDTWRRCAAWHLALFPYLYGLASQASATGIPVMRGLMIEAPEDPEAWVATTQYMLGDALLAAPVLEPGARSRRVYLPEGTWFDCWTGEAYEGRRWVEVDAPLERWPVLQRGGTVVPMLAEVALDLGSEDYAEGRFDLELRVAPGVARSERVLHDGTVLRLEGSEVVAEHARAPRRYVSATPDGRRGTEGHGTGVRLPF